MKLALSPLATILGGAALGALLAMTACTATDDDDTYGGHVPSEGGTMPDGAAADAEAGSPDARADADAGPRTCSDDGFCHTVVASTETLNAVWGDGTGVAWAVGERGSLLRWEGDAWKVHAVLQGPLLAVWGAAANDVWVGGAAGLFHGIGTASASLVFEPVAAPGDPEAVIRSIWGTGPNDVWAAGSPDSKATTGRVLHREGGFAGTSWKLDPVSSNPIGFARVWGTSAGGVWAAGVRINKLTTRNEVVVQRRAAGAASFVEVPVPGDPQADPGNGQLDQLIDAAAARDGTLFVLGQTSTSKRAFVRGTSTDGTTFTWTFVSRGPSNRPESYFIGGMATNDHWVGGAYGRLDHWNGTTWAQARTTVEKTPFVTPFRGMWQGQNGELWVVGDGVALHRKP